MNKYTFAELVGMPDGKGTIPYGKLIAAAGGDYGIEAQEIALRKLGKNYLKK